MKLQIARFSPHQNAKVVAFLMAVVSLVFLVPFFAVAWLFTSAPDRPPLVFFLVLPLIYFGMAYVSVAVGCAVYNALYGYVGGIEIEYREPVRDVA